MTKYWYMNSDTKEVVSPTFDRLADAKEWNKEHRAKPRNSFELIINGECVKVVQCQDKIPQYRGLSRF